MGNHLFSTLYPRFYPLQHQFTTLDHSPTAWSADHSGGPWLN